MTGEHDRLARALGVPRAFPWQAALLDRMVAGEVPSAVDVPTGLGKTAVMAVWLVARMAGAALPRRLVYVVDRRAVVDQATEVAEALREFIEREALTDAAVKERLGLDGELPISTLRGQHVDNRAWLSDPSSAAIVLGTVDMVGSRLLFQGYGVSRKMRPYHAGLLGADTLVVLDEAHLVPPFERLLESIAGESKLAPHAEVAAIVPRFSLLPLSATGKSKRGGAVTLSAADHADPVVQKRVRARKTLELRPAVDEKNLASSLVAEAIRLSDAGASPTRILVFCNRRNDAEAVQAQLSKALPELRDRIALFVGSRRVYEREDAASKLKELGFLAGRGTRHDHASFVVATSAAEVGVDLDADHMISDLVPFERMVQRLGRVNRRGDGSASVIVVPTSAPANARDERLRDYARLDATSTLLAELPVEGAGVSACPSALVTLRDRTDPERIAAASSEVPLYPPLQRPLVEAWSMTSLHEHTGRPPVGAWLRGWTDDEPQTTVIWRRFLPVTQGDRLIGAADLRAFLDATGPHLAERLEAETDRVVAWLEARLKQVGEEKRQVDAEDDAIDDDDSIDAVDDVDAARPAAVDAEDERPGATRDALRRDSIAAIVIDAPGSESPRAIRARDTEARNFADGLARDLRGATLVVDERVGGLNQGLLSEESDEATEVPSAVVGFRVARKTSDQTAEKGWREELRVVFRTSEIDDEPIEWLTVESRADLPAESEEGRSVSPRHEQTLDEHHAWTESEARSLAARLELPAPYAEVLCLAARLHDEGKRAPQWQRAFRAKSDAAYAKTTHRPLLSILGHYRHELGSLPRAEKDPALAALPLELRELCLHLIAAHHGGARPLLRTDGAEEPPTRLAARAQEIALRFARLERTWGPWGLAWWEALLRAADQRASRRNDERADHGDRDG